MKRWGGKTKLMKWGAEPLSKAQNGRTDELSSEIERFGLWTVIHTDSMNSVVCNPEGIVVKQFNNSETAWQSANRFANDKMVKDLIGGN